jgi:hypothetical protein
MKDVKHREHEDGNQAIWRTKCCGPLFVHDSWPLARMSATQTVDLNVFLQWCSDNDIWVDPRLRIRCDSVGGIAVYSSQAIPPLRSGEQSESTSLRKPETHVVISGTDS